MGRKATNRQYRRKSGDRHVRRFAVKDILHCALQNVRVPREADWIVTRDSLSYRYRNSLQLGQILDKFGT